MKSPIIKQLYCGLKDERKQELIKLKEIEHQDQDE